MSKKIIITGAMGSGKSTVLKLLQADGFTIIPEPAREILAEQRSIDDEGLPEKNPKLFTQLLLSRAIYQYQQIPKSNDTVIFDRGIPDNIAYAQLFQLDYPPAHHAAKLFRYDATVFIFPAWEEIYTNDDERKMSFEDAKAFGDDIQKIYTAYGYTVIEVPRISTQERAKFIQERI